MATEIPDLPLSPCTCPPRTIPTFGGFHIRRGKIVCNECHLLRTAPVLTFSEDVDYVKDPTFLERREQLRAHLAEFLVACLTDRQFDAEATRLVREVQPYTTDAKPHRRDARY